ncbi:fumarylacetoacetate hydrolase family protein [Undibacterium sp. JH2W]|uniref:fumarylacetoacetate hydrolase family protein n=1 Tax=Undibacterium sp. JH2W TaxID=3413037 RepID=UPI003BEFE570
MTNWLRFEHQHLTGFGCLESDTITVFEGDLFNNPTPTGKTRALAEVRLLTPCLPSKMLGLWNNYHELASKLGQAIPAEPLYFIKTSNSYLPHAGIIKRPPAYDGKILYEGELGIVIGKTCSNVGVDIAADSIFGYTCVNDVTALELLQRDATFAQWSRAKSCDSFGVFGPVIATGLDGLALTVKTFLNGKERQNYACRDMIFAPAQIVSMISREMTLFPGDVIACGTSIGAGPMRSGQVVEIVIDGIGSLRNYFESVESPEENTK